MIVVRKRRWQQQLGDTAPIGYIGFGTAAVLSAFILTGWIKGTTGAAMLWGTALWTGGLAVLLAAVLAFVRGAHFEVLFFGMYGSMWLSFAVMVVLPVANLSRLGEVSQSVLALLHLVYSIFTVFVLLACPLRSAVLTLAVLFLFATFVLNSIDHAVMQWRGISGDTIFGTDSTLQIVSGYCCLVGGTLLVYYGAAIVNGWPVFRPPLAEVSMEN